MNERKPLSKEAIEARRLPHPAELLQAEQDRPVIASKARVATVLRTRGKNAVHGSEG